MATDPLELERRRMELTRERIMRGSVFGEGTGESPPDSFIGTDEELKVRNQIAFDVEAPGAVGAGKAFIDLFRNAKALGLHFAKASLRLKPKEFRVAAEKEIDEKLIMLSEEAAENQQLFDILNDRRKGAGVGNLFTGFGLAFAVPGSRVTRAITPKGLKQVTPRQATLKSEAGASAVATLAMPQDPQDVAFNTITGTAIGATVFKLATGINSAGRMFVGGREATIQNVDELREAEEILNVTGLLTTGEIRSVGGKGVLPKIEGVFDNLPVPLLGLSGKRIEQNRQFQNAVNQIQAAFPDIGEAQARKLIAGRLASHEKEVQGLYAQIAQKAKGTSNVLVRPTHYVQTAEKMLAREQAKGAAASPTVISELESIIKQGPVNFQAAADISSDLGTKIRKAERGATDPAATGIDAGRQKLLAGAFYRDMETWARAFPETSDVFKLWNQAKTRYKELILPFNKRPLAPIFDENGFDSYSLSKAILDPNKAEKLSKLDEGGALAFLFVNDAITQATRSGQVNVKTLANIFARARNDKALRPLLDNVDPESAKMIGALVRLVDAAPRAFLSSNNIIRTTGASVGVGAVIAGGAFSTENEALGAALGTMSVGLMRFAIGTPAGRAILTSAQRIAPGNRQAVAQAATRMNISYQRFLETAAIRTSAEVDKQIPKLNERTLVRLGGGLQ